MPRTAERTGAPALLQDYYDWKSTHPSKSSSHLVRIVVNLDRVIIVEHDQNEAGRYGASSPQMLVGDLFCPLQQPPNVAHFNSARPAWIIAATPRSGVSGAPRL